MPERILIAVAWPYANGPLHVGHLAGAYLPADIFARYHRLRGNRVLMVSGSDCHGTPITLQAEHEGITPQELIQKNHRAFLKTFQKLGIGFDLFTQTYTANHYDTTRQFFTRLERNGYLHRETTTGSYSESLRRFLPDRFVEGICPHCSFGRARGDQCDNCGRLLDPSQLNEPRSTVDGAAIDFRKTEHYVLDLPRLEPSLRDWIRSDGQHWRANTLSATEGWLREGLRPRAITRDLEWGVPVPVDVPGFENKRIYVWFDAVIGYYSASKEWAQLAQRSARLEDWQEFWTQGRVRPYYFIGKDNIPFHTIIWPSILLGYGGLALPYDVPANEFLNYEGQKMSTSRNWALWAHDIEDRYPPDVIRYYLAANAPEGKDANWSDTDFRRRNNEELLSNWGNLVNRVLTMAYRNFGCVPEPGSLLERDRQLLESGRDAFAETGGFLDRVQLRAALHRVMAYATRVNQYVTQEEPWKKIKNDPARARAVVFTALQAVDYLKTLYCPFLPFSSQSVHDFLGYSGVIAPQPRTETASDPDGGSRGVLTGSYETDWRWEPRAIPAGQPLREPAPLFDRM